MSRILVVEDDKAILRGVTDVLKKEGFEVLGAPDGRKGLDQALRDDIDLAILDVRLPEMDGFEVCRRIREDRLQFPILMLTAKSQEADKVLGLGLGADDYMTKPFGIGELVARVKALLRRSQVRSEPGDPRSFTFGTVDVDFEARRVTRSGREVTLTAREFDMLRYLIRRRQTVVTRDDLLKQVWHYEELPVTRTVDVHVAELRKKLEKRPAKPRHILSVRSVGYRFEP
ncbi:MAG TPA: response regulator transcription factor [Planctomycetota bacterium]|nr:response regulator transcription factor [Planctomycetota bacterium]